MTGRLALPQFQAISIHSLLTKGDPASLQGSHIFWNFNPLPSHEGRQSSGEFLEKIICNFNPLPSHEGRPSNATLTVCGKLFQSTPFSRRETTVLQPPVRTCYISIHSLLTKGDQYFTVNRWLRRYFNPLPSHEGRQQPLPVFHPILPHFIIHIDRITSLSPSNSSVCAHIFRKLHYSSPVRISRCFCVHLGFAPRSLFQSAMAQTLPGS